MTGDGRPPPPDGPPDVFADCDMGQCNAPADTWFWDADYWAWLAACRSCAAREAL